MFFTTTPLRHKIIQLIIDNPVPYRNTDIMNPYLILSITLFFSRYKAVLLNELYYKGLIELHGDVDLFIKSKKASDTKYLSIAASLTQKGMAYYKLNMQNTETEAVAEIPTMENSNRPTLSIVR